MRLREITWNNSIKHKLLLSQVLSKQLQYTYGLNHNSYSSRENNKIHLTLALRQYIWYDQGGWPIIRKRETLYAVMDFIKQLEYSFNSVRMYTFRNKSHSFRHGPCTRLLTSLANKNRRQMEVLCISETPTPTPTTPLVNSV